MPVCEFVANMSIRLTLFHALFRALRASKELGGSCLFRNFRADRFWPNLLFAVTLQALNGSKPLFWDQIGPSLLVSRVPNAVSLLAWSVKGKDTRFRVVLGVAQRKPTQSWTGHDRTTNPAAWVDPKCRAW